MKPKVWRSISLVLSVVIIIEIVLYAQSTSVGLFLQGSPFTERLGETQSLRPEVVELKQLVLKHALPNLGLDQSFASDVELRDRANEFLYPLKIKKNSRFVASLNPSSFNSRCQLLDQSHYVSLYQCP